MKIVRPFGLTFFIVLAIVKFRAGGTSVKPLLSFVYELFIWVVFHGK